MSQQFEQREEQLSKKELALSQLESISATLSHKLGVEEEESPLISGGREPHPSPEVDAILDFILRQNGSLIKAASVIDSAESVDVDEILKEKDEEIQTLKGELDMRSDKVEKLVEEAEGYRKAIRDLELKIKKLLKENEGLKASNTKKK